MCNPLLVSVHLCKLNTIKCPFVICVIVACIYGTLLYAINATSHCIAVTELGDGEARACEGVSLFAHTFNCRLTVASHLAIYAINETQIYTSGVYTNYYRGYKYPSSCPTNRYGPACLYQCNCEPEYCHIVLGCTDSDPSAALSAAELTQTL